MPHPDYTLPRELAGVLSRCAAAAHYLPSWYGTNNAPQAVAALKQAATQALRAKGEEALTPQEREEVGRLLAELAALR
jgi:hypothetical protein